MRFPWLQVDADFISAHAGDLGAHLGISRREAIGLAVDLWTWALARAPDDSPPEGLVTGTGPVPDRLIAGSVGWTGPAEQLTEALAACGLAIRTDSGYRLTGFSRYKATWEKNRRRAGGKPERNRAGTGEEPARKTQTQTQTQIETRSLFGAEAPAPKKAKAPKPEKPTDPRHRPLSDSLAKAGWAHHGGRTAKAVSELLDLADQRPETAGARAPGEVLRRAGLALAHVGFPRVREIHELPGNWGHFEREATVRPDAHGGILRAGDGSCALCGEQGECSSMGEPSVLLCKAPCSGLVFAAMDSGEIRDFTQVATWVARRRVA